MTGHAYLASSGAYTWPQAVAYCQGLGYHLATIDDATENTLIWDILYDGADGVATNNAHTWIGYHDDGSGWAWVDGTTSGFQAFGAEVITDPWGTANFGQAAAFGNFEAAEWLEAPGNWIYAAICESEGA